MYDSVIVEIDILIKLTNKTMKSPEMSMGALERETFVIPEKLTAEYDEIPEKNANPEEWNTFMDRVMTLVYNSEQIPGSDEDWDDRLTTVMSWVHSDLTSGYSDGDRANIDMLKEFARRTKDAAVETKPSKQETSALTQERLSNMKTLEVILEADMGSVLEEVRKITGEDLRFREGGLHLTIIGPTESKTLNNLDDGLIAELQQINEQIKKGEGVTVTGIGFIDGSSDQYRMREVDEEKRTSYIALDIPALQEFRSKIGLPKKDFHVTLGFVGGDIHMYVERQEPVKPGSPKMKNITKPIPKRVDPRLAEIHLPNIHYGGLGGQEKESKQ